MARTFSRSDELKDARFVGVDLRGARFVESDLSGIVMRGIELRDAEIDAPWLPDGENFLRVNGVDVVPFVEAELDRRFPGRSQRRAVDPEGLRAAWAAVQDRWAITLNRAAALPPGIVDISVDGEWSFAQTLRHLVHATDVWLRGAILELDQPFHPLGQIYEGPEAEVDRSLVQTDLPAYAEVLEVRAGRVAMMSDFLVAVTPTELETPRKNPWNPEYPETTRACLRVILEEEWEHLRFAVRDLDAIEARGLSPADPAPTDPAAPAAAAGEPAPQI